MFTLPGTPDLTTLCRISLSLHLVFLLVTDIPGFIHPLMSRFWSFDEWYFSILVNYLSLTAASTDFVLVEFQFADAVIFSILSKRFFM